MHICDHIRIRILYKWTLMVIPGCAANDLMLGTEM